MISDLNNLTKTIILASAQSASSVQAYLRGAVFNASSAGSQIVTITIDANTTSGLGSGMKLTGFYNHPDGEPLLRLCERVPHGQLDRSL